MSNSLVGTSLSIIAEMMKVLLQPMEVKLLHLEATCTFGYMGRVTTIELKRIVVIVLVPYGDKAPKHARDHSYNAQQRWRNWTGDELLFAKNVSKQSASCSTRNNKGLVIVQESGARKKKSSKIKDKSNSFQWAWRAQLRCRKREEYFLHSASPAHYSVSPSVVEIHKHDSLLSWFVKRGCKERSPAEEEGATMKSDIYL